MSGRQARIIRRQRELRRRRHRDAVEALLAAAHERRYQQLLERIAQQREAEDADPFARAFQWIARALKGAPHV